MAVCFSAGAHAETPACEQGGDVRIWISPRAPQPGQTVRVLAVVEDGQAVELSGLDPEGRPLALVSDEAGMMNPLPLGEGRVRVKPDDRSTVASPASRPDALTPTPLPGGEGLKAAVSWSPVSVAATIANIHSGHYRIEARRRGAVAACREFEAGSGHADASPFPGGWNASAEALYSAWIERLFDAPAEDNLSFPSLEPVLRDAGRNFLYDYLGQNEDARLPATPDCADLPYFLRSYFAWKLSLPMGFRACSRGSAKSPPRCGSPVVDTRFTAGAAGGAGFQGLMRKVADTVHSGSARTGLDDEASDFYPVELSRRALRPGTVYADPYGHVLVVAKWIPQTADRPGLLLAVDAQPDNSVTRKRFWEGTFLYAENVPSAGPGFKAFRPWISSGSGAYVTPPEPALADGPGFIPYSLEQDGLPADDFYARVGKLINPAGLAPEQAYRETLDALVEQLVTRVTSIDNAEAYFRKDPAAVIAMPQGAAIFETIGPWEDYSTPSRDLRLIIAMRVLTGLPDKIVRHPELFRLNGQTPESARAAIQALHARSIEERRIRYTRTDGSAWELSVADILARQPALEAGYDPNDCVEYRWGAEPGSAESATCRRHAPAEQRARMEQYRTWFHEARRPTR